MIEPDFETRNVQTQLWISRAGSKIMQTTSVLTQQRGLGYNFKFQHATMAPARTSVNSAPNNTHISTANTLTLLSDYTHTLDSLPLDLSRNFADLRELDAVLSSSMASITEKILALTQMLEQGTNPKEERLWLLTEIAEDAGRLKLGDEDKIRVACHAADSLKVNRAHLTALAQEIPGFDPAALNRKTTYPHVAARSFMPAVSLEGGRRRRGGYGSLLVSMPDPSPAKRKRAPRDEDLEVSHIRSPKKDRAGENINPRSRARAKKCVHFVLYTRLRVVTWI
jgi:inhibitor of growth protein 3